jgi:hypothetical protein
MSELPILVFELNNQTGTASHAQCTGAQELLVPQRRHRIHICSAASRDIARQQGDAQQQDSYGGEGRGIGCLDVKKPEMIRQKPIESQR